jgi:hypothetical protein
MRRLNSVILVVLSLVLLSSPVIQARAVVEAPTFPFAYNAAVAAMMAGVQSSAVSNYVSGLTGKTAITVGGAPFTLTTRNMYFPTQIAKATQYVYEFMQNRGLTVSYQNWYDATEDLSGRNVIGTLTGTVRPAEIVLVVAHLDNMPETNPAPGADDNASGSTGVMMSAARLAGQRFERTVRFIFFTGEEQGALGSYAYATAAKARGENIVAVYNMDMIGWDANNDGVMALETRVTSSPGYASDLAIATVFTQVVSAYGLTGLHPVIDPCSDQYVDSASFWARGYPSVTAIEDWDEGNPYYHTKNDTLATLNLTFLTNFVKASVGTVAHMAVPASTPASATVAGNPVYDGWLLETGEKTGLGGAKNATAATFNLGDDANNKQYLAILHFDTTLPKGAIVTAATLKIKKMEQVGTAINLFTHFGSLWVDTKKPSFGVPALAIDDFQATGAKNIAKFGVTPVNNWYSAAIGKAYINTTGSTQFRLHFNLDDNNDFLANYLKFYSGNAVAALRPLLVIQYHVP